MGKRTMPKYSMSVEGNIYSENIRLKSISHVHHNSKTLFKHVLVKDKSSILCHYERLPTGCTNPDCPFKHSKPRDTEAIDLQKKVNNRCKTITASEFAKSLLLRFVQ